MKLRTKFMLVTGVTTFLVLTCVLLVALCYLSGTLNRINHDASEYAVKDMQQKAKSNLRRFGDILAATHARASTFYTSKALPKEELIALLSTRFEHSSGADAVLIGKYDLRKKDDFLSDRYGMVTLHSGTKEITTDFPGLYNIIRRYITENRKKTVFAITASGECWVLSTTKDTADSGRFFAVRICPETLNGTALDLKSGLIIMQDNKILYQNFSVFDGKLPEKIIRTLPDLAMTLKRCQPDEVVWRTFTDAKGRNDWLAGATIITPNWRSGGTCLRLIRVYEYQEIMSDVTKMLHTQTPALIFYTCMILLFGMLILLLPLFCICRQLTVPIVNAGLFANKLAGGDFSAQSSNEKTGIQEIDQLTKSLNHMRDHLNAMIGKIRRNHGREVDARMDAENINLLKSDFLDAMSLDYREPLNSLYSFADLLEHNAKEHRSVSADDLLAILKAVHISMDKLSGMNGIMGELAEIDTPFRNSEQAKEQLETYEIIHQVNNRYIPYAKKRSISLEFSYNAQIPMHVVIDKTKFQRIYGTFLSALCTSANRGANIRLAWKSEGNHLILSCSGKTDQYPAPLEYILYNSSRRPLRQFESSAAIIHFTIIRKLLQALNGNFDIRCPDDENYEMELQFDISEKTEMPAIRNNMLHTSSKQRSVANKTKISQDELFRIMTDICQQSPDPIPVLLCEDDESDNILLSAMLRGLNCNVTAVYDLKTAYEKLQTQSFDIMVLELQQRDLEPAEALQDIKSLQKNPDMFLITVDAAQENDGRTMKLAGANRSLLKPIHLDELTEAVSAYLQKRR